MPTADQPDQPSTPTERSEDAERIRAIELEAIAAKAAWKNAIARRNRLILDAYFLRGARVVDLVTPEVTRATINGAIGSERDRREALGLPDRGPADGYPPS